MSSESDISGFDSQPVPREVAVLPQSILYVSAADWRRSEARRRGMRAVAPEELGLALAPRALAAARAPRHTSLAA